MMAIKKYPVTTKRRNNYLVEIDDPDNSDSDDWLFGLLAIVYVKEKRKLFPGYKLTKVINYGENECFHYYNTGSMNHILWSTFFVQKYSNNYIQLAKDAVHYYEQWEDAYNKQQQRQQRTIKAFKQWDGKVE